jgi:ribosome-associated toxin RatA of RatAB toxin-antitoxin module
VADVVRDSIVISADPDSIMDVIADYEAYPEWQDEIKEVEILETDEDGWGTTVRFKVDATIAVVNYTLAYTYDDNALRWTMVEGDKVKRNEGSYELTEQGDGTTLVEYDLEVEPGIKVPSMLRRQAQKRIVRTALEGLKRRVESAA